MKSFTSATLLSVLLSGLTACSNSESGKDSAATETTTTTTTTDTTQYSTIEVNALSIAYPGTLALSMFPESGTSLRLAAEPTADEQGTNVPYAEKIEEADKRLRGEGDCFNPAQLNERSALASQVTCYEFDSDMNPSTFSDRPNQTWGTKDGTDGAGQACMVTFAKSQVESVTARVDRALAIVQGLLCAAKKADKAVEIAPDTAAIQLAETINSGMPSDSPITFNKADMSAVTNSDGSVTYITQVDVKRVREGKIDSIVLRHTPAKGDVNENGILTFVREPKGGAVQNDPNKTVEKYDVMSITYERSVDDAGAAHMIAELNQAQIHKSYEPFNDEGTVNFEALPDNAQNGDVHAIKYVAFDVNPETGAGSLSYWMNPGGAKGESARGFLFNIAADDAGVLSGCGISGATDGVSIRAVAVDATKSLSPARYWHPRHSQNTSPDKDSRYATQEGNLVTQQCFLQDTTTGLYKIDTSKTTHERGYDVIAGTATAVRPPERPPVPENMPPPPPVAAAPAS